MDGSRLVIAGGGMVAGYAAKKLVDLGYKTADLTILSADTALPYERPPLSKGFLAGKETEESIHINSENYYREHGIQVRLACRLTAVDPSRKRLILESGEGFEFDRLIIATGSHPRTLSIPGADLGNVYYLRLLADSKAIRQRAAGAKRAVIAGGGFIGMEVASVLAQAGIETTMVMREDRVWKQFFTPEMSRFFESYFTARGVQFVKEATLLGLNGDGVIASVQLAGGRVIECDLLVAGIGARPATEWLAQSGLETPDGVIVNEFLETTAPAISAAGDIANYPDLIYGKRRRVEHWDNAVAQAEYSAARVMGEQAPFRHVPYFFSDVFDLSYEFWGDPAGAGQVISRGDLASNSFSVWWLQQNNVVAAFVMNRPGEERDAAPKWIEAKEAVSAAKLADQSSPILDALEHRS
jgi:NADPH-dependent 2,4-dienoyl-CoA reductase/sulfur reductase-like enzyme